MKPYLDTADRMDVFRPHDKSSLSDGDLSRARAEHRGDLLGFSVWGIDGEFMRTIDIDFTTGGNPARYRYVPPGEIWVERFLSPTDAAAVYVHECLECIMMVRDGTAYDDAHDRANMHEHAVRMAVAGGSLVLPDHAAGVAFAASYVTRALTSLYG